MKRGKFITFEGPEGSGKSTHIRRLARRLRAAGCKVLVTREPGGTPTGEAIRGILQHDQAGEPIAPAAELLLFEASRAQLVARAIEPALARGLWVLCDRFADSTTAYQAYGRGFEVKQVLALNDVAMQSCLPDLTLLLDVPVAEGFARLTRRYAARGGSHDRFEREALAFHTRVRQGYLRLARRWPSRIKVIDTARPAAAVADEVWRMVSHGLRR